MMVSKNNKYQRELMNSQQVPHFGLRKLGIGVASVLLGTTFYFGGNMANVHADATPAANNNNATQQQTNVNSAETNQTVALKTTPQTSAAGNSATPTTSAASQISTTPQSSVAQQSTNVASSAGNSNATTAAANNAANASQTGQNSAANSTSTAAQSNATPSQSTAPTSNAVADSEVNSDVLKAAQKFTLGNEKDADATAIINNETGPNSAVTTTNPSETVKKVPWMITGKDYKYTTWITFKDEKGQHLDANSSVKIIYSNLQNSSYNGIKIKKAVYTFSNFVFDPSFQTIDLGVYSNPHSGFAYIGIKDFRISIQYFADDEMKQPINFTKGTAYFVFASLNQDGGHNERARAVNGTPIELAGSSIKSHADGWLYADVPNSDATWLDPNTGKIVKGGWDNIGDGTYVGAGAAEISGTNPIVEFKTSTPDVWSLLNTDIPATVYTDPQTYTITETIHYQFRNGKQAKPDYTKTLLYHRTGYKGVTGHITYDKLIPQTFPAINSPKVDGYVPDIPTVGAITDVTPAKDSNGNIQGTRNIEYTVTYDQLQQAQVLYRDVNDSKKPVNLDQDNNLTGVAGQTITDPNVDTKIANLINKGYVLKNNGFPSDAAYDNDGSKVQTFYIDFVHGNQPVNPQTPGTPGKPINPNDPKGPKYPAGTDPKSLTKTITRTIHYTGAGDKTPKDIQQPVTFTQSGVLDKVTGQWITPLKWSATSQDVASEKTPFINGYHVTNVDRDSQDKVNVDGATIKNTDNNYTVTVTYAANGKIIPVDPNGNPIPNAPTPQYPTDPTDITKVTPNEPVPNVPGWTPDQPTVTPSDPGADTDVVYRVPAKDEGIVNVIVHDNTTGQNLPQYAWTSHTQKTGTKVDFDKPATIKNLENAGYKVINPEVTVPSEITKGEVTVVINVEHGTVPVTPDTPGTPGQPINPNDPNSPKYPNGTDKDSLTKTITRTIHYVGAGDKTPKDVQQPVTFTQSGVLDKVTGEWITPLTWKTTSQNVAGVKTPVIAGYHVTNVDRDSQDKVNVDEVTIHNDDGNYTVTVTYAPNGKIVPVDPNGNPIPNVPTPQYPTDPTDPSKVTPDEPVPNVPGMTPETPTVTPTDPGKDTKVIYNVPTKDEGVVNVIVHDTTTGQNLPKYGWTSGTQKTGTKVDFDKPTTIKNLENAGYKVLNPDVTVPGEITKGETNVVINVEHGTTTVTPDKPGTPGQPVDPNNPNGPKYPAGTDLNSLKKTGTQTIHYVGAGDQTPADNTQSFDFTKTITFDNVTGKIIKDSGWSVASHTFGQVTTPVVQGYHADKASAGGTTITPDDLTKEVTVTYAPNGKIIPVDPNGKPIPNVPTPQYPTDPNDPTKVTPDEPVPNVPGQTPETPTVTPTDPGKDTHVIYNVPTKDEGVVNVIVTDTTTGQNLTDYGWTSGTQKTGTKVDFDKPGTIKKLEDAGYKVTNPDVTVPGEITKGTTNVVIKVEHQIVPVTPDKPGNGLKATDLTKTVTETVHYVGAGDQTPADKTTQLHFTGTAYYDAVTKKWTDANGHELKDQTKNITWTAKDGNSFAAVATPAIAGYTAKVQDGYDDGNGNVKEITNVDQTSGDITVTVTYSQNGQPTTPTNPTNPTNPENPNTPVTPENPNNNSETPVNPGTVNPGTPTNANTPNGSINSVYPGTPANNPMNLANSGANTYMGSTVQPVVNYTGNVMGQSTKKHATSSALPQTGNNDAVSAAALGLMGLAATAGLGLGATKKRHE